MLYNRGTGWADWELSNFWNRISYIDDFPYNILEALAEYLKTGEEQNVEFNAEGWFYTFRFTYKKSRKIWYPGHISLQIEKAMRTTWNWWI